MYERITFCVGEKKIEVENRVFDLGELTTECLNLPKDKIYKAELIDVWNMTREVIAEQISGETKLTLPGRDNLALLITRIK